MNSLIKLAVGAAIAGAVVTLFVRRNAGKRGRRTGASGGLGRMPRGSQGFTLEEIAGENAEWGGGSSGLNT